MRKRIGLVLLAVVVLAAAGFGFLAWKASANLTRTWDLPSPPITRATAPDALARGEQIFTSVCADCHFDAERQLVRGRRMTEVPAFLGVFHSANITRPVLDRYSDEELARVLRVGIRNDGQLVRAPMSRYDRMSDDDVAAVIAYMRSDAPVFAPSDVTQPRVELTLAGKLIQLGRYGPEEAGAEAGRTRPTKGATVAYGEYMANAVYQCWDCHTKGFGTAKLEKGGAYGGGFPLADAEGKTIYGPNLTFSKQGLAGWSITHFASAMRNGVHRDGTILRYPMPRYRLIDDTEMAALYAYLQSVPKSAKAAKTGDAKPREKAPPPDMKPEEMFARLGCASCHAKGAPFRERFEAAAPKDPAVIAAWIRNPEKTKPDTQMPTFESLLTEEQALALANWVKSEAAKAE